MYELAAISTLEMRTGTGLGSSRGSVHATAIVTLTTGTRTRSLEQGTGCGVMLTSSLLDIHVDHHERVFPSSESGQLGRQFFFGGDCTQVLPIGVAFEAGRQTL